MMPLLQSQFGVAPPSFKHSDGGLMAARILTITKAIYPALKNMCLCRAVTMLALSSLSFHQGEVERWPVEHYVQTNCQLFRSAELLAEVTPVVCVQYPWDQGTVNDLSPIVGTGIPPHVVILQELFTMREASTKFIADFHDWSMRSWMSELLKWVE
jgi:hypothetical protein